MGGEIEQDAGRVQSEQADLGHDNQSAEEATRLSAGSTQGRRAHQWTSQSHKFVQQEENSEAAAQFKSSARPFA